MTLLETYTQIAHVLSGALFPICLENIRSEEHRASSETSPPDRCVDVSAGVSIETDLYFGRAAAVAPSLALLLVDDPVSAFVAIAGFRNKGRPLATSTTHGRINCPAKTAHKSTICFQFGAEEYGTGKAVAPGSLGPKQRLG
jgi:hypothetical protein